MKDLYYYFVVIGVFIYFCRKVLGLRFWFELRELRPTHAAPAPVAPSSASDLKKLRVLSQNAWAHHVQAAPGRFQRMQQLAEYLAGDEFDVVCMQELFIMRLGPFCVGLDETLLLNDAFTRMGYPYRTSAASSLAPTNGVKMPVQSGGLVTYSKFPIVEAKFVPFKTTAEVLNNKGYEQLTLQTPRGPVVVFNTHMDSRKWDVSRRKQAQQLGQAVTALPKGTRFFVCGDFNTCSVRDQKHFQELEQFLGGAKVVDDAVQLADLGPTFRPDKPNNVLLMVQQFLLGLWAPKWTSKRAAAGNGGSKVPVLDHIFYSKSAPGFTSSGARIVDVTPGHGDLPHSDHFGVAADLTFF